MKKRFIILCCCLIASVLVIAGIVIRIYLGRDISNTPNDDTSQTTTELGMYGGESLPEETDSDTEQAEPESDPIGTNGFDQTVGSESENDEPRTEPSQSETDIPEIPETEPEEIPYEVYLAMTAQEQEDYFNRFSSVESFFIWYNAAKEKYLEENPDIEIGPGGSIPIP